MGVERGAPVALDLALEFPDAAQELMVELVLLAQLSGLPRECLLGTGEFLRESGDDGLGLTDGLHFQLINAVSEAMDEANDGVNALIVNLGDVGLAE